MRGRLLFASVAVAGLMLAGQALGQEVPTVAAVRVETVSVDVSVLREGRAVAGLTADDFEVRDEGTRQSVDVVAAGNLPLHVLLVMDTSGSVSGLRLQRLRQAALALVSSLGPMDRAGVLTFAEEPRLLAGLETSPVAARAILARLETTGATALRDAAWAGLKLSERVRGRMLVVLFSDGIDTASWLAERAVEETARESNAVLHVIYTGHRSQVQGLPGTRAVRLPGEDFLDRLAGTTGGRLWSAGEGEELSGAVGRALAEMRSRYVLRFDRPPDARPGWHRLEVRLKGAKADLLARRGYFVPGAQH